MEADRPGDPHPPPTTHIRHYLVLINLCFGSRSEIDPESTGSADPNPGRSKFTPKKGKIKKFNV